ncbi:BnaC08g48290D [Brassica napus]|uniref:BnaC08g48290D protein n=2 Tax=Brassica TaxID=3705 RepID=A0A078JMU2_BRANA|nr:BnaC08g48290D [Brassica napus]
MFMQAEIANALTPAKCRGITVFNLEEHYDENLVRRNLCSTQIKKEKPDKSS